MDILVRIVVLIIERKQSVPLRERDLDMKLGQGLQIEDVGATILHLRHFGLGLPIGLGSREIDLRMEEGGFDGGNRIATTRRGVTHHLPSLAIAHAGGDIERVLHLIVPGIDGTRLLERGVHEVVEAVTRSIVQLQEQGFRPRDTRSAHTQLQPQRHRLLPLATEDGKATCRKGCTRLNDKVGRLIAVFQVAFVVFVDAQARQIAVEFGRIVELDVLGRGIYLVDDHLALPLGNRRITFVTRTACKA